ncbi:MAG: hypothetical protein QOG64_505, partial [Acidimicrobiaceae bacterium]|nr:hypothetical protein [Acidimicrobiaceae bacterium]
MVLPDSSGGAGSISYSFGMRDGRTNEALAELAAQTRAIVADHGRDDLGARLAEMLDQIEAPAPRVVVAGDFKQGKSTLVNALAGGRVVPVDDDGSTGTTTEVIARTASPGDDAGARLVTGDAEKHLRADEVAAAITEPAAGTGDRWWSSRDVVPAPESTTPPPTTLVDRPGRHGAAGVPVLR